MVIDFEHHYIPLELARRMGINTETRTIVEAVGKALGASGLLAADIAAARQPMPRADPHDVDWALDARALATMPYP